MDRTLFLSGSLVVFVGALGLVSGCETGVGTTSSSGTGTSSSSGEAGTGGTGGAGGSAGAGGTAGTGGMTGSSSTSSSSTSSTSSTSTSSTSGMAGAGGVGGSGGTGGMAGAAGAAGAGGSGGTGGGMVVTACKVCGPNNTCLETCVPTKPGDDDCDGWTVEEGDCCNNCFKCGSPASVNPGAFEYLGNGSDDDCDPATLDTQPPTDCTDPPLATPTSTIELVKAMDLCQFTAENPPIAQKKWGVISSSLLLADGTNVVLPKDIQVGVLAEYGPYVKPIKGLTLASLSTGTARDETDPGYVHPQNGPNSLIQKGNYDANTAVPIPADYLAQHNGVLPQGKDAMGNACPACSGANCTTAFDSVNFKMRVRVPTNAKSFSYRLKSYSAEYPEYTCQQFNDFFITRLKTAWLPDPKGDPMDPKNQPLPLDRNIAFDAFINPISVNNAFYDVCFPYIGAPAEACSSGTLELVGTGMGGWNGDLKDGGGTVWLTNEANVVPGETIEIEFIIFDAGDHNVDSIVLLDYFRWGLQPTAAGVHK